MQGLLRDTPMKLNIIGKLHENFFKGAASKNAEIYFDCLAIINEMNNGLSYKVPYREVKDRIMLYLQDAKVAVKNEEDVSFSANLDRQPGEIISQMIRYGWLETDTKEGSFEKEIYISRDANLFFNGFLKKIDSPQKIEFSNYIISIYSLLHNREAWADNPYYSFLKPVYQSVEELSDALIGMNTYMRDTINSMMSYSSYRDITEAMISNAGAEFSEEFSRLSSRNIHWFRFGRGANVGIIDGIEAILEDSSMIEKMSAEYARENHTDEIAARAEVLEQLYGIIDFMTDRYEELYDDIQKKTEKYIDTLIGRFRSARRFQEDNSSENMDQLLDIIRMKLDLGEETDSTDRLFALYGQEIIDYEQACRQRESRVVSRQPVEHVRKLSSEDRRRAVDNLNEKKEDPFSREKVQAFIKAHMKDGEMRSRDIPLAEKAAFLLTIASAMYADGAGYAYESRGGYCADGIYTVKDYVIREKEASAE